MKPEIYAKRHTIWHKFEDWLIETFGEDYNSKLSGFDVIEKVEDYVKKNVPEIKIVYVDDTLYSSSIILLIPHFEHGISVMFIPQCTEVQNTFFLYDSHFTKLIEELNKMKYVYKYLNEDENSSL